jgi:hypothetical protein
LDSSLSLREKAGVRVLLSILSAKAVTLTLSQRERE